MASRRYGFDFLNTLSQKIGDLSGFVQMSRELAQNADDEGCDWIRFQFTDEALIVSNPSLFDGDDFDNITNIGSEGKIEDAEKTGRFGVGFVSVFQICDHPVIRSNRTQLTIYPERQEAEEEDYPQIEEGTQFYLEWAKTPSIVRKELKRAEISSENIESFSNELISALPDTMLFLRHTSRIDIILPGSSPKHAVRLPDQGHLRTVIVHSGEEQKIISAEVRWLVIERPDKRIFQISGVARKDAIGISYRLGVPEKEVNSGLVYCTLPTRTPTGLPVSINADFCIKSDRMTLVDQGNSPDVSWNRGLVGELGDLYVEMIETARGIVPEDEYARLLPSEEYLNPICEMLAGIHEKFHATASRKKILKFTTKDGTDYWDLPGKGRLLSSKTTPELFLCLKRLGIPLVVTPLQTRWNLLQKIGVKAVTIDDLADLLEKAGYETGDNYAALPDPLMEEGPLKCIYEFIYEEITKRNAPSTNLELAKGLVLCPCRDDSWLSFASAFDLEEDILDALPFLAETYHIVDPKFKSKNRALFERLCSRRDLDLVIEELQEHSSEAIGRMANKGTIDIFALYDCIANRKQRLQKDEQICRQLALLNIFPARKSGEFKPLRGLSLPGNFDDPIGLDVLIDTDLIDESHVAVLKILGISELNLIGYLRLLCPSYFENPSRHGTEDKRVDLLDLIRRHLSSLDQYPEMLESLKETKCVLGQDGNYHKPRECYFEEIDLVS